MSRLVTPTCAPRCSARRQMLRVYESPSRERECRATKSRRHAAIAGAAQTHQIAVAELHHRHRFAERQLKLVARIRAPEHAGRCDCASACCSSAVSQACVSLVVRGVGRRSNERHRRAADKRLLLLWIWLVAERQQARTADSEREWHTQQVSAFRRGAGWCWCARCAQERSGSPLDDTLSQRELPHSRHTGTLQLHALLQHVRAVPSSLFLEDVSPSQI